jgi:DNA-directed RNA polymerase specialized sigma24 family protein
MLYTLPLVRTGCPERFQQLMRLPTATVAQLLAEETEKFLKHVPSDDLPGMVLFIKAISLRDEEAWTYLYRQYTPLVLSWITQQHGVAPLLAEEEGLSLINATFARLYQALTPEKLESFPSLSAFLRYLRCCASSAVADERRSRQERQREISLERLEWEPLTEDPADEVVDTLSAHSLWRLIAAWTDENERLLLVLTYSYGMTPMEICHQYRDRFPKIQQVYSMKQTILQRLRRNRCMQALCEHLQKADRHAHNR